jgi:hypothetical protein
MKDSFHWYKSDYHLHKEHADLVWIYFLMLEKAKEYRKVNWPVVRSNKKFNWPVVRSNKKFNWPVVRSNKKSSTGLWLQVK